MIQLVRIAAALAILGLGACESLQAGLPGIGAGDAANSQSSELEAVGPEVEAASDPETGLAGAALCISSAYYLADLGAVPEEQGVAFAERWTAIIEVIPETEVGARQTAVDDAYALLKQLDSDGSNSGFEVARALFENETCTSTDFQRSYIARWGDAKLMEKRLAEGATDGG